MNYKVIPVDKFKKEAKRLLKKHPSLKSELAELAVALSANPTMSTALGHEAYEKFPLKVKGKAKVVAPVLSLMLSRLKRKYTS